MIPSKMDSDHEKISVENILLTIAIEHKCDIEDRAVQPIKVDQSVPLSKLRSINKYRNVATVNILYKVGMHALL